jgi:hypothetical protein
MFTATLDEVVGIFMVHKHLLEQDLVPILERKYSEDNIIILRKMYSRTVLQVS